jgi:hypothetical protein
LLQKLVNFKVNKINNIHLTCSKKKEIFINVKYDADLFSLCPIVIDYLKGVHCSKMKKLWMSAGGLQTRRNKEITYKYNFSSKIVF